MHGEYWFCAAYMYTYIYIYIHASKFILKVINYYICIFRIYIHILSIETVYVAQYICLMPSFACFHACFMLHICKCMFCCISHMIINGLSFFVYLNKYNNNFSMSQYFLETFSLEIYSAFFRSFFYPFFKLYNSIFK